MVPPLASETPAVKPAVTASATPSPTAPALGTSIVGTPHHTIGRAPDPYSLAPARPPIPATGAWREGDPIGERTFVEIGDIALEAGGLLPSVHMAYETWGQLNESRDNAVLVLHALTGDSHVIGQAWPGHATPGWWSGLVGPGAPIDTDHYYVVAPNVLGGCQGTTGPASIAPDGRPWGSRFPYLTMRDQVAAERALADELGVEIWAIVIGGSMGGMRALEWAVSEPARVERLIAVATTARTTADQIAWATPQVAAIRSDLKWQGGDYYESPPGEGPHAGLGNARRIAHATYRAADELERRFGREVQSGEDPYGGGGRFAVESYLDHHADKLARRFDANSYLVLTESVLAHDVGRGRGGVDAALRSISARTLAIGVDTDRLYPLWQSRQIAAGVPGADPLRTIHSDYGHDGFLIEIGQVSQHIGEFVRSR